MSINFTQYQNQLINIDQSYGSQCFDWSVFCARIISNNNSFYPNCSITGGVADWIDNQTNWINAGWVWEDNYVNIPTQIPPINAIFVEKANSYNPYGHTGLVIKTYGTQNKLDTMEQNIGSGDGQEYDDRIQIRTRDYNLIAGWFYYPEQPNQPTNQIQEDTSMSKLQDAYKKLVQLNPDFNQIWIESRFEIGSPDEIAKVIQEVYSWKIQPSPILQAITDEDVKANQKYKDLEYQLQFTKNALDVCNLARLKNPNDKVIRNEFETANLVKEQPKLELSTFQAFVKNQMPTIALALSGIGVVINVDQFLQWTTVGLTVISFLNSFYLEYIKKQ